MQLSRQSYTLKFSRKRYFSQGVEGGGGWGLELTDIGGRRNEQQHQKVLHPGTDLFTGIEGGRGRAGGRGEGGALNFRRSCDFSATSLELKKRGARARERVLSGALDGPDACVGSGGKGYHFYERDWLRRVIYRALYCHHHRGTPTPVRARGNEILTTSVRPRGVCEENDFTERGTGAANFERRLIGGSSGAAMSSGVSLRGERGKPEVGCADLGGDVWQNLEMTELIYRTFTTRNANNIPCNRGICDLLCRGRHIFFP